MITKFVKVYIGKMSATDMDCDFLWFMGWHILHDKGQISQNNLGWKKSHPYLTAYVKDINS